MKKSPFNSLLLNILKGMPNVDWRYKLYLRKPLWNARFVLLCLSSIVLLLNDTSAATLTVTTTNDSGPGSLRSSIQNAAAGDTIWCSVLGIITLTNGQLSITKSLDIRGPGAGTLVIDANRLNRIVEVSTDCSVSLSDVTLKNGRVVGTPGITSGSGKGTPGGIALGGAVLNSGTLTLTRCMITESSVKGGAGGAGTNSWASGAGGNAYGAGIYNLGFLTLANCEISSNSAAGGGGGSVQNSPAGDGGSALGAGLYGFSGQIGVTNCAFIANTARGSDNAGGYAQPASSAGHALGGAVFLESGSLSIVNSSILTNQVKGGDAFSIGPASNGGNAEGAGLFISNGVVNLLNSSILGNSATGGRGGMISFGLGGAPIAGQSSGGGVQINGGMNLIGNCCLAGNSIRAGDGGSIITQFGSYGTQGGQASGAAIYVLAGGLNAFNTTICSNSAFGGNGGTGGGMPGYGPFPGGLAGAGQGGGMFVNGGAVTNMHCTLSGNLVLGGSGYLGPGQANGAGLCNTTGIVTLLDVLLAGNQNQVSNVEVSGIFSSLGHNLIGMTNGSSGWISNDLVGSQLSPFDPKLGPLSENGGPTMTMPLLTGSPAIDQGSNTDLRTDQRGRCRIYDDPAVENATSGNGTDIGAFELQNPAPLLAGLRRRGNDIVVDVLTEVGLTYRLERSASLAATAWSSVTDNIAGNGALIHITDPNVATNSQSFYRSQSRP